MKKNRLEKLVNILTTALGPISTTLLGGIIIYFKYIPKTLKDAFIWIGSSVAIVSMCVLILLIFLKTKIIEDFDITKREQRPLVFGIFSIFLALLVSITYIFGYTEALDLMIFIVFCYLILFIITLFWKISIHVGAATMTILVLLHETSYWYLYPLVLLPIIVAWTRVYLKRHTVDQVIGGMVLPVIVYSIWRSIF